MGNKIKLAGVDLAWRSEKIPTAIAIGSCDSSELSIERVIPAIFGIKDVLSELKETNDLTGIAIDAPLIINKVDGQRDCEKEIGETYGSKQASCHTSNTTLYPSANSVKLSNELVSLGFEHLGKENAKWQIECYPHPAIIEIFGLEKRLKYKKGLVSERREGQVQLGKLIKGLSNNPVLKLNLSDSLAADHIDEQKIHSLKGQALKTNEDALDAIICLYIAALYSIHKKSRTLGKIFGEIENGYIWVPQPVKTSRTELINCLLYTSPSPRDRTRSRMPSSA